METFLAIWLDKSVLFSGNSHFLGGDYGIRKNKMAARFSLVSGRSKRRGKFENLGKIAFRKRHSGNRLRRRAIHRRVQNSDYVNKLFFAKTNTKIFSKIYIFCSENKHKEFLQIFFFKWIFLKLCWFSFCKYLEIYTKTISQLANCVLNRWQTYSINIIVSICPLSRATIIFLKWLETYGFKTLVDIDLIIYQQWYYPSSSHPHSILFFQSIHHCTHEML